MKEQQEPTKKKVVQTTLRSVTAKLHQAKTLIAQLEKLVTAQERKISVMQAELDHYFKD